MNPFKWKLWKLGFCLIGMNVSQFLYVQYVGYESIYKKIFWRFYWKQHAQWIPMQTIEALKRIREQGNNPSLVVWSRQELPSESLSSGDHPKA